jgi:hypothetical protein
VYDASLSRLESTVRNKTDASLVAIDASVAAELEDAGDDEIVSALTCGNGVVDPFERCDIAIALGRVGACPEGCSGRELCTQHVLVGRQCTARCVDVQITQPIPDDGCCPSEVSSSQDNDCASTCGNRVVERGEQCDPPETCARKEACVSHDVCEVANYRGDPKQCTAACEFQPIQACLGGDGCCPPGCTSETDTDCRDSSPSCDGGCQSPADAATLDPAAECSKGHQGGDCETCDCANCQDEVLSCLTSPGQDGGEQCEAVSRCSAKEACTGLDCYCGNLNSDQCRVWQAGPCVAEISAAGGTSDVRELITLGTLSDGPLGRWVKLMSCRRSKCQTECKL